MPDHAAADAAEDAVRSHSILTERKAIDIIHETALEVDIRAWLAEGLRLLAAAGEREEHVPNGARRPCSVLGDASAQAAIEDAVTRMSRTEGDPGRPPRAIAQARKMGIKVLGDEAAEKDDDIESYLGTDDDGDSDGASDADARRHVPFTGQAHQDSVEELVMSQASCSRSEAVKALKANDCDVVKAIMELTMTGGSDSGGAEQDDGDGGAEVQVPVAPQEEEQKEQDGPTFTEAAPLGNMFAQNDEVKALGARWDAAARTWTAPVGAARADFEPWVLLSSSQQDLKVPYAQKDAAKQEVGAQWDGAKRKWFLPKHRLCARNLDFCRGRGWLA